VCACVHVCMCVCVCDIYASSIIYPGYFPASAAGAHVLRGELYGAAEEAAAAAHGSVDWDWESDAPGVLDHVLGGPVCARVCVCVSVSVSLCLCTCLCARVCTCVSACARLGV